MVDLTIHHMLGSRSERVVWLAEELGIPYEVVLHIPNTKTGSVTSTLTDHVPDGKAPSVFLDGQLLKESGYIVEHLAKEFPSDQIEASPSLDSIYWAHFAEGRIMTQMGSNMLNNVALPFATKNMSPDEKKGAQMYSAHLNAYYKKEAGKALDEADKFIQDNVWFSGTDKPGIGDVMMLFPLTWCAKGNAPGEHKLGRATAAWLERVQARPAYKRMQTRMTAERNKQHPRPAKSKM